MTDLIILGSFFALDFMSGITGLTLYLLLLFPPYLFVRNHSSTTILYGGGGAVFLSELLHQHTIGTYMLGVGVSLFLFHWFLDVINWHHFLPQVVCLLGYFIVVALTRVFLARFVHGLWLLPPVLSLFLTYVIGVAMIAYRFRRIG